MSFPRSSGILLHPTSLPGAHGIGELGGEAHRFADFLKNAGQTIWQVLPLGPTGYGDSPYQCFSAFAGNPLLISLEKLVEDGILSPGEVGSAPSFPTHEVDYGWVIKFKLPILRKAAENFKAGAGAAERDQYEAFCRENAAWLDNYAMFAALKDAHGGEAVWNRWERDIAMHQPRAIRDWQAKLADEVDARRYWQYQFFKQWGALKQYCHRLGIPMM